MATRIDSCTADFFKVSHKNTLVESSSIEWETAVGATAFADLYSLRNITAASSTLRTTNKSWKAISCVAW